MKTTGLPGSFLKLDWWDIFDQFDMGIDNLIDHNQAAGSNVLTSASNLSPNFILAISVS